MNYPSYPQNIKFVDNFVDKSTFIHKFVANSNIFLLINIIHCIVDNMDNYLIKPSIFKLLNAACG